MCEKSCSSDQFGKICEKKKKKVLPTQLKLTKYSEPVLKKSLKDIRKIIKSKPSQGDVDNLEEVQYGADVPGDITTQHARSPGHWES